MPNALPRARHATTPIVLSGLFLLAACSAGAQPSPSTSPGPSTSPAPSTSPSPTVTPAPTGQTGQIDHPTDPTAVVLRMHVGGGFVPMEFALVESPVFTLYGDNTIIFRPSTAAERMIDPGLALAPYVKASMNPDQVDALLRFALSQGGLLDAREDYSDVGVADAPNTIFTINAGGVDKQVFIAALGFDMTGADAADRQRFTVLSDLLDSFEEEVAKGNVESTEIYQPTMYRALLPESFEGQQGEFADWAWDDLTLDDFPITAESGFPTGYLTPEQAAKVTEVPSGGIGGILIEAPDGTRYQLAVKPVLPDEAVDA